MDLTYQASQNLLHRSTPPKKKDTAPLVLMRIQDFLNPEKVEIYSHLPFVCLKFASLHSLECFLVSTTSRMLSVNAALTILSRLAIEPEQNFSLAA